jgi:endonuclease/exonuclease/phosphatase family metal-dependent hydrolase
VEIPGVARPLLVYGTVITAAHGGAVSRPTLSWQRHLEAVHHRRAEWRQLGQDFPDHAMCVAGDFNTNLDEAAWYGTAYSKQGILQGLADIGMKCLTTDELRSPLEQPGGRGGVDHVCFSDVDGLTSQLEAWPAIMDGHRLSDRGGIVVELAWSQSLQGSVQAQQSES